MSVPVHTTVEAQVTYAASRKTQPFRGSYAPTTPVETVRSEAMVYFGVADATDAAGNQIVFRMKHAGETIEPSRTLESVVGDKPHAEFRLIREVVAG